MFDDLRVDALRVFDQVHQRHIFVPGGDLLGLIAARLRKPALEIRRRGVDSPVSKRAEITWSCWPWMNPVIPLAVEL
jgi:hypothetical protein